MNLIFQKLPLCRILHLQKTRCRNRSSEKWKKISKGTEPRKTDLMSFSNELTSMKWPHNFCINHNQNLWPWLLWNGNDSLWPWPYYVFLSPGIAQSLIQINDRCKPSTCAWIVHCRQTRQKPQQLDWDWISIAEA